jgi:aminoglycoside phosphotransferase (APT) family kinase protein
MDRVDGNVWDRPADVASVTSAEADSASRAIVEALVSLHGIDPDAVGLGQLGRPEGFLERRIDRWMQQWPQDAVHDRTPFDDLGRRLLTALPSEAPPGLVHGDYRLGNVMFSPGPDRRVAAVLDWELSTLGDRLTDLAHLVLYWAPIRGRITHEAQRIGGVGGFWTAAQLVAAYGAGGTLAVDDLDWYLAFDSWRAAVIKEGIHARSLRGETRGEGDDVGVYVPLHLEDADELLAERGH